MRCSPTRLQAQRRRTRCAAAVPADRSFQEPTTSAVIALDAAGNQLSDIPLIIVDNGAKTEWIESFYLQDEWKMIRRRSP
jgi:hypothetical protein